jgi:hypothetical protein
MPVRPQWHMFEDGVNKGPPLSLFESEALCDLPI